MPPAQGSSTPDRPKVQAAARPRYVMMGGFLGAGKTTAAGKLAEWLRDRGLRAGLITNDQGRNLVDTTVLRARGFEVAEIPGGCFCCRFPSLVEAAERLTTAWSPNVLIAEPVGSCTDLAATVAYPLRQWAGCGYEIAPLSVLVDPVRALRMLGLAPGGRFSSQVDYIYRKQLEEADLIVLNKTDLVQPDALSFLRSTLASEYPHARLFEISARHGAGLEDWFEHLLGSQQVPRAVMEVDYELYANGEARLGWLNCMLGLGSPRPFDGNELLRGLAAELQKALRAAGAEVAHLKMTLSPPEPAGGLTVVNLVRNDLAPELAQALPERVASGVLTINLRAEAAPELLTNRVERALEEQARPLGLSIQREHWECFRPGKPQPTHRVTSLPRC